MGNAATLERMFWIDGRVRRKRYPIAFKLLARKLLSSFSNL
jgi:hypothetical protein